MDIEAQVHEAVERLVERGAPFFRIGRAPWIETVESRLGFELPIALRALVMNYEFPPVDVSDIELFGNCGDGADDDITVAPFQDPSLCSWLSARRSIQFARPASGSYDPVSLESRSGHSAAVIRFDHEGILQGAKKVITTTVAPSFEQLLKQAAA